MVLFNVVDVLDGKEGLHQCPELSTTSVRGVFVVLFIV